MNVDSLNMTGSMLASVECTSCARRVTGVARAILGAQCDLHEVSVLFILGDSKCLETLEKTVIYGRHGTSMRVFTWTYV